MNLKVQYVLLLACVIDFHLINGYRTFGMLELGSCDGHPVSIIMRPESRNSSGILVSSLDGHFVPDQHCVISLKPPITYEMVVSIRTIALQRDDGDCSSYLEITPIRGRNGARLCGYSNDDLELNSFSHWGDMTIVFHTANSSRFREAYFQLTFTAARNARHWCLDAEKRCHNKKCVWKGLMCDGHNNCGDASDELNKYVAECTNLTPAQSLAVILVTVVGSLILLVAVAYLKGPKLTQQIERLSRNAGSNSLSGGNQRSRTNGHENLVGTNGGTYYGSGDTSYPHMCDDLVINDQPPCYEDVQASGAAPVSYIAHIPQNYTTTSSAKANRRGFVRPQNSTVASAVHPTATGRGFERPQNSTLASGVNPTATGRVFERPHNSTDAFGVNPVSGHAFESTQQLTVASGSNPSATGNGFARYQNSTVASGFNSVTEGHEREKYKNSTVSSNDPALFRCGNIGIQNDITDCIKCPMTLTHDSANVNSNNLSISTLSHGT